jgi:Ser/Thr protein kinase RdoA (MazF antagonist)
MTAMVCTRSVRFKMVLYSNTRSSSLHLLKHLQSFPLPRLLAYNGLPSTRSSYDKPTRDKVVELFQGLHALYPHHTLFGPSADPFIFRFCHGDLHHRNILIDPRTGKITGIIDWECAGFRPGWTDIAGIG